MKRIVAALMIIWFGFTLIPNTSGSCVQMDTQFYLAESSELGPTIEWSGPANSSESVMLAWDGAYTGQTEDSWTLSAWINDTDGVDTVLFSFRTFLDSEWTNRTPSRIEGNDTRGLYQFNYTYAVWWNYTLSAPQWDGTGGNFDFKIIANDTLGHTTETGILIYSGGYMIVNPPPDVVFFSNIIPIIALSSVVIILAITLVFLRRK